MTRRIALSLLATVAVVGCPSTAKETTGTSSDEQVKLTMNPDAGTIHFEATLSIDHGPGEKRFHGVWLHPVGREPVERFLIGNADDRVWHGFDGRRVEVTGRRYQPGELAIEAHHLRVVRLDVLDHPKDDTPMWVGDRETFQGRFERRTVQRGAKAAGMPYTVLVTKLGEFLVTGRTPTEDQIDRPVEVRARRYEPSNYVARMTGPTLWIEAITVLD